MSGTAETLLNQSQTKEIKGLAIILVIVSHMAYIMDMPSKIELLTHPFGYLGVSLFLVVSGYGCTISSIKKDNYRIGFWKRRLSKIVPLLSASTVTFVIMSALVYGKRYEILEVVLDSIGLTSCIGKFTWYIGYQYFWYGAFYIIGCNRDNRKLCLMRYLGCSAIVYIVSVIVAMPSIQFNLWGLNCFSFPIGVFIAMYSSEIQKVIQKEKHILWFAIGTFAFIFILCYVILGNPEDMAIQNILKSLIALNFCASILIATYAYKDKISKWGIQKIGEISFELYLIHGYWVFVLSDFFYPKSLTKVAFYIFVTLVSASIVHILLKKDRRSKWWGYTTIKGKRVECHQNLKEKSLNN